MAVSDRPVFFDISRLLQCVLLSGTDSSVLVTTSLTCGGDRSRGAGPWLIEQTFRPDGQLGAKQIDFELIDILCDLAAPGCRGGSAPVRGVARMVRCYDMRLLIKRIRMADERLRRGAQLNRRTFLQSFPAGATLSFARGALSQPASAKAAESLVYVSPGSISGPLARGLMPPQEVPPLPQSHRFAGLKFTGKQHNYREMIVADTWYPSWAADGALYSCWADGHVKDSSGRSVGVNCQWRSSRESWFRDLGIGVAQGRITADLDKLTTTGNAILTGEDPYNLKVMPLVPFHRESLRYEGYYPCANLYYRGIWYYGGYYCHRWLNDHNVPITYELGGFGGFRLSSDQGKTWQDTPFDDRRPLFPEVGRCSGGPPIRLGSPHFVDMGRELEHSADGYAYLVGHGTYHVDGICNWSSGDAISLARVRPSRGSMNDASAYEFFAGLEGSGSPVWSRDFSRIAPVLEWPGGAGCVNITYHPYLKKYLGFMCVGWADGDSGNYDTWIVEADEITGPWYSIGRLRGMGGQPYFVCLPSRFLLPDSQKLTLFYSANWRAERPGVEGWFNPNGPAGVYSLCVAEFELT